jgi:hypothetical protein
MYYNPARGNCSHADFQNLFRPQAAGTRRDVQNVIDLASGSW